MDAVLHRKFRKKFIKVSPSVREKFYERVDIFRVNKFDQILNNHSVERVFPGCRSINVTGDYRAIFYEADNTAIFITIGTHSELYE